MTEKQKLSLGIDIVNVSGHHDPAGLYNAYANRIGSNSFDNIDSTQTAPWAAFDLQINEKSDWNITARRYDTDDSLSPNVRAGRAFDTVGSSIHPFEWSGWQVISTYRLKF